jgi:triacylglycerol esterase/lipase EstA (alpha/beta hydrolase family)
MSGGLHTECIPVGNGKDDSENVDILTQAKDACEKIKSNPIYNHGPFNVIGFSQGGLIARYIVEQCDTKF